VDVVLRLCKLPIFYQVGKIKLHSRDKTLMPWLSQLLMPVSHGSACEELKVCSIACMQDVSTLLRDQNHFELGHVGRER
jgi:hypothetical protein